MTVLLKDALAAQPGADAGEQPGLRSWRSLRQHRPRLQLGHVDHHGSLKLWATIVVTEAGFGADLGAEKFFDIKCRKAGLKPAATVIVATVRALKMHGGVAKGDLGAENVDAVREGCTNLARHLENMRKFGVPAVVAINRFVNDSDAEVEAVRVTAEGLGAKAILCNHWADGGAGPRSWHSTWSAWSMAVRRTSSRSNPDDMGLWEKIETVAREIYRAEGITADAKVRKQLEDLEADYGHFPICMAKTQYSFSTNPDAKGAPSGFTIPIREVRLSAGAGFLVAITGDVMTMPGLPGCRRRTRST